MRYVILITVLFCTPACDKPPTSPEEVYKVFYAEVAEAKPYWDKIAGFLDPQALSTFRRIGKRLADIEKYDGDPLDFFFRQVKGTRRMPLQEVSIASRLEGKVILKVKAGPCTQDEECEDSLVEMRKAEGRWVIVPRIPKLLMQSSTPGGEEPKE
ncbi:MAG: hypothetical protein JRJ87_19120 [Deltaproteobacteria bacterium]|nr:hypothetical protein [Deltaproteobacteria bacterium]